MKAVCMGNADCAKTLLERGADKDAAKKDNDTTLHEAAKMGSRDAPSSARGVFQ